MKLIVFSATMAMILAALFSVGCGDEKESAPAETQEVQDAQEGDSAEPAEEPAEDAGEEPAEDAGEEPAEDAGEEPAEDAGEEPAEDSSDSEADGDDGEISLKFSPHKEMLASTLKTEYIVMEPIYFRGGGQSVSRAN